MLKGYLKCSDINKMLLGYIHFELSKKDMSKVAVHLRNCPNCMEKYTRIQRRKKELKQKMLEIEKTLRMQNEISSYIDNEASEDLIFILEGMLLASEEYKKELIQSEELRRLMLESRKKLAEGIKAKETIKIIAKIKNRKRKSLKNGFIQLFEPLHRVFAKFV